MPTLTAVCDSLRGEVGKSGEQGLGGQRQGAEGSSEVKAVTALPAHLRSVPGSRYPSENPQWLQSPALGHLIPFYTLPAPAHM